LTFKLKKRIFLKDKEITMNDELRNKFVKIFQQVDGGSSTHMEAMIDDAIENGIITRNDFDDNELEVCGIFDNDWFTCLGCDWILPIEDQDERGEWHCKQCMDEEYG
jgi:hypothetical protein